MRNGNIGTEKFTQTALSYILAGARNASLVNFITEQASVQKERRELPNRRIPILPQQWSECVRENPLGCRIW